MVSVRKPVRRMESTLGTAELGSYFGRAPRISISSAVSPLVSDSSAVMEICITLVLVLRAEHVNNGAVLFRH